jgi:hypothetical protein
MIRHSEMIGVYVLIVIGVLLVALAPGGRIRSQQSLQQNIRKA